MDQLSTAPVAPGQKTYVFVDEYNRHKRLKVMRACDGCRKRKIRCDGALQNGPWPCGSCVRLKLKCVPPTLDQEDEQSTPDSTTSSAHFAFQSFTPTSAYNSNDSPSRSSIDPDWNSGILPSRSARSSGPTSTPQLSQDGETILYSSHMVSQQIGPRLEPRYSDDEYFAPGTVPIQFQSDRVAPPRLLRTQTEASNSSSGDPKEVDEAAKELAEQMGDLSIELTSVAPYITKEKKILAETPAVEEIDIILPTSVSNDSVVRIPPEMMPSEERVLDYFGYFFDYIHPYVPVLNRQEFYEQWSTARHSISPLILEAIFACVARYLEEPIEVRKWLALASRHEESFKDVPRLSTIQALIILTKAREFAPKRGYYYRSWMAIKYMTTMAFDLGLQEHYDQHRTANICTLGRSDCSIRTRTWQTLFLLELLVGAPQGRTDFAVELETVDFGLPSPSSEMDDFEYQTSRRTTYLAQTVRNIKRTNTLWQTMRRLKADWALDPRFVQQNEAIDTWLDQLPHDMQLQYGDDDSPILLGGNHYVAYLHIYHHLIVIMHHRPQLQMLLEKRDSDFKQHLDICNESAIIICRLQEALDREFGLHGLQFMLRGIGFTIYCVLTCTMLHLATITSPDPATNSRARTYFTRHMRILEQCISNASQEMQLQINTLREAFSQDISKPFELKPALGMRSPSQEAQPIPRVIHQDPYNVLTQKSSTWPHLHDTSSSATLSPASEYSQPFDSVASQTSTAFGTSSFVMPPQTTYAPLNLHQVTSAPQTNYALEPVISNEQTTPVWDPSGIFNQWNTAFEQPQAAPPLSATMPDSHTHFPAATGVQPHRATSGQRMLYSSQPTSSSPSSLAPESVPSMPTVTPVMWQDAFTSAFISGQGQKRYREDSFDTSAYQQYQKRRG